MFIKLHTECLLFYLTQFTARKGVRTKSWTMPIGRVFVYTPAD